MVKPRTLGIFCGMGKTNEREMFHRLHKAFQCQEYDIAEAEALIRLFALFYKMPPPPDILGMYGQYPQLLGAFRKAVRTCDPDRIEDAFLNLYCLLHGHEAPYTPSERRRLDAVGGYWCHAGGIRPIIKAGAYIAGHTVSADYGAGNGLQGLLLQKLFPHKRTVQIEISSRMVDCGKALQYWLHIPRDKIEWRVNDVLDVPPSDMDFIYLYRPVKPVGRGAEFYLKFSETLSKSRRTVVIFSVADCLKKFLPESFPVVYNDGQLTCFRGPLKLE